MVNVKNYKKQRFYNNMIKDNFKITKMEKYSCAKESITMRI